MEQQSLMALHVALYTASGSIIVVAAVVVYVLWGLKQRIDRVVTAVERFEAEITPLARETRVAVDRLRDLSERAQRQWLAVEDLVETVRRWTDRTQQAVGVAGDQLLSPVLAVSRTVSRLQIGTVAFLRALWTGRRHTKEASRAS